MQLPNAGSTQSGRHKNLPILAVATALCGAALFGCTAKTGGRAGGNGGSVGNGGDNGGGTNGGGDSGGGTGGSVLDPATCNDPTVGATQIRRLSRSQYQNTVHDLIGLDLDPLFHFLPDSKTGPFDANSLVPPTSLDVSKYEDAARDLAARLDPKKVLPCDPVKDGADACRDKFIDTFGRSIYRRPLIDAEKTDLRRVFDLGKVDGFEAGARLVVETTLQSPNFLYVPEFGASPDAGKVARLSSWEMATRLAILLWNSGPDAILLDAAASDKLQSDDDLKAAIDRMTADVRFARTARTFVRQWMNIDSINEISKDPVKYASFNPALTAAMVKETEDFAEEVLTKEDAKLSTLLTADFTYLDKTQLIPYVLYHVYQNNTAADGRTALKPEERSGLLTQLSVLTRTATNERSPVVYRGKLIRENFLCKQLPPPPANVDFSLPANADQLTPQELIREHQNNPTCSPCHKLMDPLGFPFARYDGLGYYRTQVNGKDIDESGSLVDSDVDGDVTGARAMSELLSRSEDVKGCLSQLWFRYGLGRDPTEDDLCTLADIKHAAIDSDGDFRGMLAALAKSSSFRFVRGE